MQWEPEEVSAAGAGWHPDPSDPTGRLRWWDGEVWEARVLPHESGIESISWRADMFELPEPTGEHPITPRVAQQVPPLLATAVPEPTPEPEPVTPEPVTLPPLTFSPLASAHVETTGLESSEPWSPDGWSAELEPIDELEESSVTAPFTSTGEFRLPPFLGDLVEPGVPTASTEDQDEDERVPARSARKKYVMLVGAVLVLLSVGAGVSTAMLGDNQRPTVQPRVAYRDQKADFTFRYPEAWRVQEQSEPCGTLPAEVSCVGVLFEIGPDVKAGDANTLRVRTLDTDTTLGELNDWVVTQTQGIIDAGSGRHLVSAEVTTLAGAPAFRLEFVDSAASPPTRVVAYEGRTTEGRAITVSLTVRDPRTAPTEKELRQFLESVTSS